MQSCNTMVAVLVLAFVSGSSAVSTERFLGAPDSKHAKEDALHMWAVADMEAAEAKKEETEAKDDVEDSAAIMEVGADKAKAEETLAKKELKGKDLDAALAAAHDEKSQKDEDAKQINDLAANLKKDASDTKKESEQVKHDATSIETAAIPAINVKLVDAEHMEAVADMELAEAKHEETEASDDVADAAAIKKVGADKAKAEETLAKKELKGKDLDAALAAAHDEEAQKDMDAKQLEFVGAKEKVDAADTKKEAETVRKDAKSIDAASLPAKK